MEKKGKKSKKKPDIKLFRELSEKYSLIPLDGKKPIEKGWTKWCDEKRPFNAADFKGRNAGIPCGPGNGILAVDIDDLDMFNFLRRKFGLLLPITYKVKTGGGGTHLYFKYPKSGRWGNKSLKHPVLKNVTIFDVRGHGGVIVAPGSIHPETGERYKILKDKPLAKCPDWVKEFIKTGRIDLDPPNEIYFPDELNMVFIDSLPVSEEIKSEINTRHFVGQRSEAMFRVMTALFRAGCDKKLVRFVFNFLPVGAKWQEKDPSWQQQEMERAYKAAHSNGSVLSTTGEDVDDLVEQLEKGIITSDDFLAEKIPEPKYLIYPVLRETGLAMVYAIRGVGKTWMAVTISTLLTSRKKEV